MRRRISAVSDPGGHGSARLGDDDDPVRAGVAEGNDAATPDAPNTIETPLQILRVILAAVDHDEILHPSADEELAFGQVAEIACVKPPVPDDARGQFGVLIVAHHDRGTRQRDLPHFAVARVRAVLANDAQRMAGKWTSAADDGDRRVGR